MALLERDTHLAELAAVLRDAATGQGSVVLVTGEAGAGKTALVSQFAASHSRAARVLWGLCDELVTPRPLGPFRDMFPWLAADPGRAGVASDLLGVLVDELSKPPHPVVAVVEDAQWADEATLDAIRFVGRRITRMRAVLVVTYRDDEVPADHALRVALGAVPATAFRRIRLPPLSIDAVARLAGRDDVAELHRLTAGNPFFVHEVLAAPDAAVPPTVQDAVMARVSRLSDAARRSAELAAAVPVPVEPWLLDECGAATGADEAVRAGVLRRRGDQVAFAHELARRAVRNSLPAADWQEINGRILDVMVPHDADPALLTHHAVHAGRAEAVARYAPLAGRRASSLGSHAEAYEHFRRALDHAELFDPPELLDLMECFARAATYVVRLNEAYAAVTRAIELCSKAGDKTGLGRNLYLLSEIEWSRGRGDDAVRALDESVVVLETEQAADYLVDAYSQRARFAMLDHRDADAVAWGERATGLARDQGLPEPVHAMVTVGTARLQRDGDESVLTDGLAAALAQRRLFAAARAYVNLADVLTLHMRYDAARRYIDDGLEFFDLHDLLGPIDHMLAIRARWHLDRGEWAAAELDGTRTAGIEGTSLTMAELVVGLLQVRRGDPSASATLEVAERHAARAGEAQHLVPVALARAELAWLTGDIDGIGAALEPVLTGSRQAVLPRWVGETALWSHRAGLAGAAPSGAAAPYRLQLSGRWAEAAARWAELGRPYEQADALAGASEPEPLLAALEILDRLGAVPRAAMVRRELDRLGVRSVPRGPRGSTLASPAGLTTRQTEVLELLAERLTYQEIAERLHLSVKTVDHHVSAIRSKLAVASREAAVVAAKRLRILS